MRLDPLVSTVMELLICDVERMTSPLKDYQPVLQKLVTDGLGSATEIPIETLKKVVTLSEREASHVDA
jgi:hypothetical protein